MCPYYLVTDQGLSGCQITEDGDNKGPGCVRFPLLFISQHFGGSIRIARIDHGAQFGHRGIAPWANWGWARGEGARRRRGGNNPRQASAATSSNAPRSYPDTGSHLRSKCPLPSRIHSAETQVPLLDLDSTGSSALAVLAPAKPLSK